MLKHIKIFILILVLTQCKAQTEKFAEHSKSSIEAQAEIFENLEKSRIELEKVYEENIDYLDSIRNIDARNYKSLLMENQNSWKTYCEGKCKISEYQSRNAAQGGLPFYNLCMTDLNIMRTAELKNWLMDWKVEFNN